MEVDYADRRARVLSLLAEESAAGDGVPGDAGTVPADAGDAAVDGAVVDALLVTDLRDVRYLSGFSGSAGALLLARDGTTRFATDSRYTEQVRNELAPDIEVSITRRYAATLLDAAFGGSPATVGVDDTDLSVRALADLRKAVPSDPGVDFVPRSGIVSEARRTKDSAEVEQIAAACAAADAAWTALLEAGQLRAGRTERQIAADLEWHMRSAGSDGVSFDTIVASGPNGALPHHHAGDRELSAGDLVVVDFGCYVDGYASDCTRTVAIGSAADWQREIYELTLRAQLAGTAAATAGTACGLVDAAARDLIAAGGFGAEFGHSLGHGVGLDVHEAPAIATTSASTLLRGDVVTIEPGIYLPGRGGVRIEDTVLVTDAAPRVLTRTPKDLLEL